ncbi:MAG: OPT/YSL family transporter, partial [Candidatus Eremiobacterota bacterium]
MSASPDRHNAPLDPEIGEFLEKPGDGPIYRPARGELQLTVRAVLIGCLLGGIVAAMNIYFGLQTGWSMGGSLIAAILGFSAFSVLKPRKAFTPLETNIAQTAGSAAGAMASAAGLLSAVPAMGMLGHKLGYLELTAWAASVAWLGIFFAVPLRRQMVLVEKLRFPSGTATGETIAAMFSSGQEAVKKSSLLVKTALLAAVFTLVAFFVPPIQNVPLHKWLAIGFLAAAANYGFTV